MHVFIDLFAASSRDDVIILCVYFLVTMAESLRCKVEEHLTCSVCLKQFKDPKVLPCLHSYCHDCIVKLAEHAKSSTFNCPNCRLAVKVRKHPLSTCL